MDTWSFNDFDPEKETIELLLSFGADPHHYIKGLNSPRQIIKKLSEQEEYINFKSILEEKP